VLRVILLDLGGTLTDGSRTFSCVPEALTALRKFRDARGEPVQLCLVSDFAMPDPSSGTTVRTIFADYLQILDRLDLRRFFKPVGHHVTLSAHAGAMKPERRVYELALERLGNHSSLKECVSITEDAGHVAACERLGMKALQFGKDFSDWCEGPLLLRQLIDPTSTQNTTLALTIWLKVHGGLRVVGLVGEPTATSAVVRVRPIVTDGAARRAKTTELEVSFDAAGRVAELDSPSSSVTATREAETFDRSLREHGQAAMAGEGALPPGVTHTIEEDERGEQVLRRKRFSAI
jgi:hypothetical protein